MPKCKACGAEIEFIDTLAGKKMPVDAKTYITVVTDEGEVVRGRAPHWAICPGAEAFRGKNEPEPSKAELELLGILKAIPGYPFDYGKDLKFIRDLKVDFPGLDLVDEVKAWRAYKLDKPLTQKANPRSQLRNWCKKAVEFGRSKPQEVTKDAGYRRDKFVFQG